MKSRNSVKHSLGATFSGAPFWFGILLLALAIIAFLTFESFFIKYLISIALVITAIGLLLSIQEIAIDGTTQRLNTFFKFGSIKIKLSQTSLKGYDKVILELYTHNQTMNMKSISSTIRTRSFDIFAVSSTHKTLLVEITDYKKAKLFMKKAAEELNISSEDTYQARREQAKQIKSTRKRRR